MVKAVSWDRSADWASRFDRKSYRRLGRPFKPWGQFDMLEELLNYNDRKWWHFIL